MAGVVVHHNLIEKHTQTGSEKRREASSKLMLDDNAVLSGMFYAIALFGTHPRLHLDFFGLGDCQFASNHHQISTIWAILSYAEDMLMSGGRHGKQASGGKVWLHIHLDYGVDRNGHGFI